MRECLSFHIGQAGCQLGSACWELYAAEQKILSNGEQSVDANKNNFDTTFFEDVRGKFIPRSIFADTEESVIDQIRIGEYGNLYNPSRLISTKEDAANNYARCYYGLSKLLNPLVEEVARKTVETCESLQGFMFYSSLGGGTGSSFVPYLLEFALSEYNKKTSLIFSIFPSPVGSTAIVEPYNTIFSLMNLSNQDKCTFLFDNNSLANICSKNLNIPSPCYTDFNHIVAQVSSSITTSMRFPGSLNIDLVEFPTNLIPLSRLNLAVASYAPLSSHKVEQHNKNTVMDITNCCISAGSQLFNHNEEYNQFMACCLLYRGNVCHRNINQAIIDVKGKKKIQFCPWIPTGFKVGINSSLPVLHKNCDIASSDKALCMLSNSTAVIDPLGKVLDDFSTMLSKRAFVHWYEREGMEIGEFQEAFDIVQYTMDQYIGANSDYTIE
ncbi:hypothetical protein HZS_7511 [Henneguya salminicola]|nr:hypothetical protein HZS_7511 [Henneguya salminicola]